MEGKGGAVVPYGLNVDPPMERRVCVSNWRSSRRGHETLPRSHVESTSTSCIDVLRIDEELYMPSTMLRLIKALHEEKARCCTLDSLDVIRACTAFLDGMASLRWCRSSSISFGLLLVVFILSVISTAAVS